jgi:hypothetical protein
MCIEQDYVPAWRMRSWIIYFIKYVHWTGLRPCLEAEIMRHTFYKICTQNKPINKHLNFSRRFEGHSTWCSMPSIYELSGMESTKALKKGNNMQYKQWYLALDKLQICINRKLTTRLITCQQILILRFPALIAGILLISYITCAPCYISSDQ